MMKKAMAANKAATIVRRDASKDERLYAVRYRAGEEEASHAPPESLHVHMYVKMKK